MPSDEEMVKQMALFVTSVIKVIDSINDDLQQYHGYEDTLRERIERDIKADAYDKIFELINRPLE